MKNFAALLLLVSGPGLTSCSAQLGKILKTAVMAEISSDDVASGLKEALTQGTTKGADFLSAKDGYYKSIYKIILPDDAKSVCKKLSVVPGFTSVENDVVEKINRAAEDAAVKAKPIFTAAIRQMSIQDAWNILKGQDNAATQYLHKTTYKALYDEFRPVIKASMEKVGALQLWSDAVTRYNSLPLVRKANPDMSDYVTDKALEGLFRKIAEEELNIRHNGAARTTELLKKVFSKQDK